MTWFLYMGNIPTSIPTGNGDVVSVPPGYYIEVHSSSPTIQRLLRLNRLRRVGKPKSQSLIAFSVPSAPAKVEDVQPETKFSKSFEELGRVSKDEIRTKFTEALEEVSKGEAKAKAPAKKKSTRASRKQAAEVKEAEAEAASSEIETEG